MTPTIVTKQDRPYIVIGSPGGTSIPNTVLQVIVNLLDHRLTLRQAIDAPRLHHQWLPDVVNFEPSSYPQDLAVALRTRGHKVEPYYAPIIGVANGVMVGSNGIRLGAADKRNPDGEARGS